MLVSVADRDKAEALPIIRKLYASGYHLYATEGTAAMIEAAGMPVKLITKKLSEGSSQYRRYHQERYRDRRHQYHHRRPGATSRRLPYPPRRRRKTYSLLHITGYGAGGYRRFNQQGLQLQHKTGAGVSTWPKLNLTWEPRVSYPSRTSCPAFSGCDCNALK